MAILCLIPILILLVNACAAENKKSGPVGSGHEVSGGYGLPIYDWTIGTDSIKDLRKALKAGNAYIRLHGEGTIKLDEYWNVGSNVTLDGRKGKITMQGPKGLYIRQQKNVAIMGLCFKENETGINMSAGGDEVWVHRNTFIKSAWGSPVAFSGWDCDNESMRCKREAKGITVSHNWFGPNTYGPLMYIGVGEGTFYRNVWQDVITRIPRAQNQGTFHMCNNLFDRWHLGIQGDDGAKFLYENNVFNRDMTHNNASVYPGRLLNVMNMNTDERIDVCMKGNVMMGEQKDNEVREGKGTKVTCDFEVPFPHSCPEIGDGHALVTRLYEKSGAGGWCKL